MLEEKTLAAARAAFTEYLRVKKLRKTPERYAILDKVCQINGHFGIDELYTSVIADGFYVSKATLYNTIELFTKCGIVRKHQFGTSKALYEITTGIANHLHLICQQCGKIKEVKDSEFMAYMASKRFSSFNNSYFCLYVYGVCGTCARRKKRMLKDVSTKNKSQK